MQSPDDDAPDGLTAALELKHMSAALEVAMLADSYASMSIAHSHAAETLSDADQREKALVMIGEAQAYHHISVRLIVLAEKLRG